MCLYCQHTAERGAIRVVLPDWKTGRHQTSTVVHHYVLPPPDVSGNVLEVENEGEDEGREMQMARGNANREEDEASDSAR